ncbi:MAG: hypothetical protein H0T10_06010 [Actinobacteria bacterium]|nr:hypothetical protein [Actinomycetota bacterium]
MPRKPKSTHHRRVVVDGRWRSLAEAYMDEVGAEAFKRQRDQNDHATVRQSRKAVPAEQLRLIDDAQYGGQKPNMRQLYEQNQPALQEEHGTAPVRRTAGQEGSRG